MSGQPGKAEADEGHGPIIIVRRHGDHEEGHHGGAWKIAFADFMTAMMCFFLVMWLINAANEQTKASVASYFNPVKLVDRNTSKKGLDDADEESRVVNTGTEKGQKGSGDGEGQGGAENTEASEASETPAKTDSALFADPYAMLAEIAAQTGTAQNISEKGEAGAQASGPATGASGGEAYRDPFAPDFWTSQMAEPSVAEASAERSAPAPDDAKPGDALPADVKGPAQVEPAFPAETPAPAEAKPPAEKPDAKDEPGPAARAAAQAIREALAKTLDDSEAAKDVSVEATAEGVVISVTEGLDFGMFEIGSAVPEGALVRAMDKIGAAIKAQDGTVAIQGHTDARPFNSKTYDNWRLSTARAHSAYYMLVRAGLDEKRIVEVAGFADRKPKNAADPLAAENRRIDILLQVKG
jgi:chemotaxis protein MotB